MLWLKSDRVIVYDRAATKTDGRFKRFWLQAAAPFEVTGTRAIARTPGGQQLISSTLLPDGATIVASDDEPDAGDPAKGEPMKYRVMVEATGAPKSARFLHVVQGADGGATPDAVTLVRSTAGTGYEGAAVAGTAVVFPVDLGQEVSNTTLKVPQGVSRLLITGLAKNAGYGVDKQGDTIAVSSGGDTTTDGGGVLSVSV